MKEAQVDGSNVRHVFTISGIIVNQEARGECGIECLILRPEYISEVLW